MAKLPHHVDPLRNRLIELTQELSDRAGKLRDYGTTFGNAWLAQGELRTISTLISDLEALIEAIKQDDEPTD